MSVRAPHLDTVLRYARDTWDDKSLCELTRLGCRRFLDDLDSGKWDFDPALPEFALQSMEGLLCFSQGERPDGTPLRGVPFEPMPWHMFCTYAAAGFLQPGTQLLRFSEASIFCPRKTVKTTWAESYMLALAFWFRKSGARCKTVAGSLKQGMEGFNFLKYNILKLGLAAEHNPPGYPLELYDSSIGHLIRGDIWDGHIDLETLAFTPELFDSFNAQFAHLDELELYKNPTPYARLRDGMKAYANKQILCTFTAGDNGLGFAAQHRDYMEGILRGAITGPDADRTFCYMAEAPKREDGSVDFTNPGIHRAANPAYGITIRPEDMLAAALQAEHTPALQKEFLTRSLNVFINSLKAWFDLSEFQRSNDHYSWSQAQAAKLVKRWYGGADLSKLHDLTAVCIVGEIPAKLAATPDWTPPEDVLVIIPHCWFPETAAAEKADDDQIPLFGWKTDGWLDMPNVMSLNPADAAKQFKVWKAAGFPLHKIGYDRKFCVPFYNAMKAEGFKIIDQPQLAVKTTGGFRYIEHKAKIGCLYYFSAEPYEYCVSNVHAVEGVDDVIKYDKISPERRIDVFDCSVFAVTQMLLDSGNAAAAAKWFGGKKEG